MLPIFIMEHKESIIADPLSDLPDLENITIPLYTDPNPPDRKVPDPSSPPPTQNALQIEGLLAKFRAEANIEVKNTVALVADLQEALQDNVENYDRYQDVLNKDLFETKKDLALTKKALLELHERFEGHQNQVIQEVSENVITSVDDILEGMRADQKAIHNLLETVKVEISKSVKNNTVINSNYMTRSKNIERRLNESNASVWKRIKNVFKPLIFNKYDK